MQSHTVSRTLPPPSTSPSNHPPPPGYRVKRVGFYGPPVGVEPGLCTEAQRQPTPASGGGCCWSGLFCCRPDPELIDVEPIPNWSTIGGANQYSMVSGSASHLLFHGDALIALNAGLKDVWLPDLVVTGLARSVDNAIQDLTLFKRDLSSDAAGISRRSIDGLLDRARNLGTALQNLDEFAKQNRQNPRASQLLATALWHPRSTSPDRPTGGAGPDILTPMDQFRANLSLDILALESLRDRIPA